MGIILSILGIAGLVTAFIYMNGPDSSGHLAALLARGVLGAIAFFAGIWLVDHNANRRAILESSEPENNNTTQSVHNTARRVL